MSGPNRFLSASIAAAGLLALAGCVGAPAPGPVSYGSPYPAPGYAQPVPPAYAGSGYAPAAAPTQVALGGRCYAGVYTCELPQALPVGAQCSCPGLGAPSFGNVR